MDSKKYIGMDVHKEATTVAVMNAAGKLIMESVVETKAATIVQFLEGLRGDLYVTFEEGTWAAWLYDLLQPHVTKVVVCDPRKNALLKTGNKSDRIDARKLTELLRAGLLSAVYHGQTGLRTLKELCRSYLLAGRIVSHHLLGTEDVRVGASGVCYSCPNPAYFGGDVDTILIRPQLYLPGAEQIFQYLAQSANLTSNLSDKGFYSRDTAQRMGGLEFAAALVRHPRHLAVLQEYLKEANCKLARGVYLASDRRRYLDLMAITDIVGERKEAVSLIDMLLGKTLLRRGVILKCEYCRTADWFSMGDLGDGFTCGRCRRKQAIQSRHTLQAAEPTWYYQLDEIVYQGLCNDMHATLLVLDCLRKRNESFFYVDELEIWKPELPRPFIEIDLCCICNGMLTIGEVKTTERIEGGGKRERRSLAKYKETALALGARRFVLATTQDWAAETLANATQAFAGTPIDVVPLVGRDIIT